MLGSLVLLARLKAEVSMTELMLTICEKHRLLLLLRLKNIDITALS